MSSTVRRRPGAEARVSALLSRVTFAGAQGGTAVLKEKLSGGGSGIQYADQPNPSSLPGEYPAEQSGDLKDSIRAVDRPGTASAFGSVDGPDYVVALHFTPDGRPFLDDAKHDRDIHAGIKQEIREVTRGGRRR